MEPIRGLHAIDDEFYRYKMPILRIANVKGNITLCNIHDIATALKRPANNLVSFIAAKLGTSVVAKGQTLAIRGNFRVDDIRNAIYSFIEKHVLCPACKLPETDVIGEKNRQIRCAACGNVATLQLS